VGIETYDAALGNETSPKGERDTVTPLIASDEVLIRRFWGFQFDDENGKAADYGVAFIVTDRQVLVLKEGGVLKKKFRTWALSYTELKDNVARNQYEVVPGSKPYFLTGFARLNSDSACLATFLEAQDRDAFAAVLQTALDAQRNGVTFSSDDLTQLRTLLC
jgi:hypothetical protein